MSDTELLGDTGIRWSAESIRKAEKLVEEGKVSQDLLHYDVFYVEGSKIYRVQTDGKYWASCDCPNGQRTSRPSCYHLAAALMVLRDEVDPTPCCSDPDCNGNPCTFPGYVDNH